MRFIYLNMGNRCFDCLVKMNKSIPEPINAEGKFEIEHFCFSCRDKRTWKSIHSWDKSTVKALACESCDVKVMKETDSCVRCQDADDEVMFMFSGETICKECFVGRY